MELRTDPLDEFDPVAHRIGNVEAPVWDGVIPDRRMAGLCQVVGNAVEIDDGQGRMRLPGRAKVILDAEVQLDVSAPQPKTAPTGEGRRLRPFLHAEKIDIEPPAQIFCSPRNGKLHVINAQHQVSAR